MDIAIILMGLVVTSAIAFLTGRTSLRGKIDYLKEKLTNKHLENQALLLKVAELEGKVEKMRKDRNIKVDV